MNINNHKSINLAQYKGIVGYYMLAVLFFKSMRVLIACEESQTITAKYRAKGIEAFSCDLKPAKINADCNKNI